MRNPSPSLLSLLLLTAVASTAVIPAALAGNDAAQCDQVIPVPVPGFSCRDGVEVPKSVDAQHHCADPEDLYTRCVFHSRLGRLEKSNTQGVSIVFSCRKEDDGSTHESDNTNTYYDIAVIQHNEKTGATCFYQHLGNHDGDDLPAPRTAAGQEFWSDGVDYCSSCHTNGPFVRSPHYWKVMDAGSHVLPSIDSITRYTLANTTDYRVYDVHRPGNGCVACHNVSAHPMDAMTIGQINRLAAGEIHGLRGESPTASGYDDFMASRVGGHDAAVRDLQALEKCLGPNPPADCVVSLTNGSAKVSEAAWGDTVTRFRIKNATQSSLEMRWHNFDGGSTPTHGNPVSPGATWGIWDDGGRTGTKHWFGVYKDDRLLCNFQAHQMASDAAPVELRSIRPRAVCRFH